MAWLLQKEPRDLWTGMSMWMNTLWLAGRVARFGEQASLLLRDMHGSAGIPLIWSTRDCQAEANYSFLPCQVVGKNVVEIGILPIL